MGERRDKQPDVSSVRMAATTRVATDDTRAHGAWRKWLGALATDADAAIAAALAYESLQDDGRDAWLDALDTDAPQVDVPAVALYAPLLGVEDDPVRQLRIAAKMGELSSSPPRALVGSAGGKRVCLVVKRLYLDFVELLECRYDPEGGVEHAQHEPLVHEREVATRTGRLATTLLDVPLQEVVEELAHAVVADGRARRATPPALLRYIDLFGLDASVIRESVAVRMADDGSRDG
ncbi:MAG: hypothetical protein KC657_02375 [Myxococcales bacterium]|nr:hypothetical protein [Myxococcales bacterium]